MKNAGGLLVSCILSCFIAAKALACASILPPYPDKGVFFVTFPEISDKSFVQGNLGIIDPLSTGDSRLLVSYRYMQNEKLTQDEQTAVLNTWKQFSLSNNNSMTLKSYAAAQQQIQKQYQDYLLWRKTRLAAIGQEDNAMSPPPPSDTTKESPALYSIALDNFYSGLASKEDHLSTTTLASLPQGVNFLNFTTQRLQQIEKALNDQTNLTQPEKIALLQKWIAAQQSLFAKRDDVKSQPDLSGLNNTNIPLLNADVIYMQAANEFLSNNPQQIMAASKLFDTLATNPNYPWSGWMRYMQYRAISVAANRMAMHCDEYGWCQVKYDEETQKLNQQATEGMIALIKSTKDPAIKSAASDYVSILAARFPEINVRLYATLEKFIDNTLLGNFIYLTRTDNTFNKPTTDKTTFQQMLQSPTNYSDFQQWLTAVHVLASNYSPASNPMVPTQYQWSKSTDYNQNTVAEVFSLSYQQWKHLKSNHAWLWLALLAHDGAADQNQLKDVIKAVFKVPSTSPDYFSLRAAVYNAAYQQPLLYFKNLKSFNQFIQDTVKNITPQQGFTTQLFWQDTQVANVSSIDDLLRNTFILHSNWQSENRDTSLREGGNDSGMYPDNAFTAPDDDGYFVVPRATLTINELPLNLLVQIAQSSLLPDRFKPALYVSVWERAYLLQYYMLAAQLEDTVAELNPTLKPSLDAIYAAKTPDEKRLQFLSLLLHFPRISPVIELRDYADWRPIDFQFTTPMDFKPLIAQPELFNSIYSHTLWNKNMTFSFSDTCSDCNVARYLNTQQQAAWRNEHQQINQLPDGAIWVTEEAIFLAKAHPEDQRNAELLALAIQATRYSNSTDPKVHVLSKTAYTLLHQLYPSTQWAKKSQYYY